MRQRADARTGAVAARRERVDDERRNGDGKGAGRPLRARLCAAEKRSSAGPRAQRASYF